MLRIDLGGGNYAIFYDFPDAIVDTATGCAVYTRGTRVGVDGKNSATVAAMFEATFGDEPEPTDEPAGDPNA